MTKYICRTWSAVAMSALVLAACSGGEKSSDTLSQDTTLNRDLQMAQGDTTARPQLTDVPATTTPAPARTHTPTTTRTRPSAGRPETPAPRPSEPTRTASGNLVTPTPGAGAATVGTISAGTRIDMSASSRVCTNTNKVGDRITATVSNAVSGANGAVIPAGATAALEITSLKRSENVNDKIQMGFRVLSISFGGRSYPVNGTVVYAQVDRVKNQPQGKDVQKVATGTAVGAVLGRVFGKSTKATVIGGAVGAAAGAGAAVATANYEGCVPQGGRITVTLDRALQVNT